MKITRITMSDTAITKKKVLINKKMSQQLAHSIINTYVLNHDLQKGYNVELNATLSEMLKLPVDTQFLSVFELHSQLLQLPSKMLQSLA